MVLLILRGSGLGRRSIQASLHAVLGGLLEGLEVPFSCSSRSGGSGESFALSGLRSLLGRSREFFALRGLGDLLICLLRFGRGRRSFALGKV